MYEKYIYMYEKKKKEKTYINPNSLVKVKEVKTKY